MAKKSSNDDSGLSETAKQIIAKRAEDLAETERIVEARKRELERKHANEWR